MEIRVKAPWLSRAFDVLRCEKPYQMRGVGVYVASQIWAKVESIFTRLNWWSSFYLGWICTLPSSKHLSTPPPLPPPMDGNTFTFPPALFRIIFSVSVFVYFIYTQEFRRFHVLTTFYIPAFIHPPDSRGFPKYHISSFLLQFLHLNYWKT